MVSEWQDNYKHVMMIVVALGTREDGPSRGDAGSAGQRSGMTPHARPRAVGWPWLVARMFCLWNPQTLTGPWRSAEVCKELLRMTLLCSLVHN